MVCTPGKTRERREMLTTIRDQELRFVVQDSPDYYKLKCSVFNDDKKTDLIGDAWIDLQEVIVPGGGQNDLWHQLNFKGKYAGDIRIELTYYDSRAKPDALPDNSKQRDKSHSTASDVTTSTTAGARQLGPREIKRRPLPPGPGGHSSPASPINTPDQRPMSSVQADFEPDAWINRQQNNTNPPPRPPKHPVMPETPDDVGYDFVSEYPQEQYEAMPPVMNLSYDRRSSSFENEQMHQNQPFDQRHPPQDYYDGHDLDQYNMDAYQQTQSMHEQRPHSNHRGSRSRGQFEASTPPRPSQPVSNSSSHQSSPHNQPLQILPSMPMQQQSPTWQNRGSPSPTKHAVYRDSPLRQSISQHEMPPHSHHYVQQPEDDEPPPPPPAHGNQLVRMPMPPVSSNTGYGTPMRTSMNQPSVEERSPLQKLEYTPYQRSSPSAPDMDNQYSPAYSNDYSDGNGYVPYHDRSIGRRNSYNETLDNGPPRPEPNGTVRYGQQDFPQQHGASPQNEFRHSTGYGRPADNGHRNSYGPPRRAQTFDDFTASEDRQTKRSEPLVVRPRAISPNPAHQIPRKSITPTPATPEGRNSMTSTPFGPDSYDVLNPGPSPSADIDPFATPEQVKEAARQKELDKTRDLGPIIGNDGRIIDPSDHLPADTWAPEPERKNRKPEHVIRIRTREEARMHNRSGSSPSSARPHSIATSPYQPSPESTQPLPSQYAPAIPPKLPPSPQAESPSGRNRLKKPMPNRPPPNNPYPHAHTSPAVMTVSSPVDRPSPTTQRYSIGSSPPHGHVQRPPLNEYQIPAGNTYHSRGGSASGSTRPDYSFTPSPTKASYPPPPSVADYSGYGADESLALELSTIDIGPSRGPRTAVRSSRGYGGY